MKDRVRSGWHGALLVCAKCDRKLGGGFGAKGRQTLAKALSKQPQVGRKRKAALGVTPVKCLGVCPRGAVTVVDTRTPETWLLVRPGDDLDALVAGPAAVSAPVRYEPVLFAWGAAPDDPAVDQAAE